MSAPSLFPLQEAGLKEGDYIISVSGKDCKWSKHAEVVQLLKSTGEEGVEIGVITLQGSEGPRAVSHVPSLFGGKLQLWRELRAA